MGSSNNLEIKGSLQSVPFAELICEINRHRFSGSLRLSNETQKVVVYFDTGAIIFAVSNARQHRFYEVLLQTRKITKDQLAAIADFTNDLALRDDLVVNNLLEKSEVDALFAQLIEQILQTLTAWQTGEWIFSPLVRLKSDVRFQVDPKNLLIKYARNIPAEAINRKFKNIEESFKTAAAMPSNVNLTPHESFVYSRFENSSMTPEEIKTLSGLPESETFQIIYNLWLGGFLESQKWSAAFSERYVAAVSTTRMSAKKDEPEPDVQPPVKKIAPAIEPIKSAVVETVETLKEPPPEEKQISLDEYLDRTKTAQNFYDIFALPPDSTAAEIKKNYFALAKRFHPDLYRHEAKAALHQRIQDAFSNLAHAYEVLKDIKSREVYDFKMRKELVEMRERIESGATEEEIDVQIQTDQAAVNFDQGFDYLMDGEHESAVPYLARAVFYAKENARFHAYYGKALSAGGARHQHQAESELQTAIKLDGQNADYRIMMAEFYIQIELFKRAEGELNRLLAIFPNNGEAQAILDTLRKK